MTTATRENGPRKVCSKEFYEKRSRVHGEWFAESEQVHLARLRGNLASTVGAFLWCLSEIRFFQYALLRDSSYAQGDDSVQKGLLSCYAACGWAEKQLLKVESDLLFILPVEKRRVGSTVANCLARAFVAWCRPFIGTIVLTLAGNRIDRDDFCRYIREGHCNLRALKKMRSTLPVIAEAELNQLESLIIEEAALAAMRRRASRQGAQSLSTSPRAVGTCSRITVRSDPARGDRGQHTRTRPPVQLAMDAGGSLAFLAALSRAGRRVWDQLKGTTKPMTYDDLQRTNMGRGTISKGLKELGRIGATVRCKGGGFLPKQRLP